MRLLVLSLALAHFGCKPHARLEAPEAKAPEDERLEAYKRLRPRAEAEELVVKGSGQVVKQTTEFVVLGDGRRVYHADDFLSVVPADSAAARAAKASGEARSSKTTLTILGIAAGVVGTALVLNAIGSYDPDDPGSGDPFSDSGLAGWVLIGAGTGAALVGGQYFGKREHDERVSAFATYSEGLRARLELCLTDGRLASCGSEPTPAAVPARVAPAPAEPPAAPVEAPEPPPEDAAPPTPTNAPAAPATEAGANPEPDSAAREDPGAEESSPGPEPSEDEIP